MADEHEVEEVKVAVTRALMALKSTKGSTYFWKALQNPKLDTSTHLTYAMALANLQNKEVENKLIARLSDPEFNTRFAYAVALGSMGNQQALTILTDALEHGYGLIRRFAVVGLESIADEKAIRALAETANSDSDPTVRILSASSLMSLGYPDYEVILWDALDNKKEDVRSEALIALGNHMDATMLAKLKWYLKREPSVPVRQTIHHMLRQWSGRL